MNVSVRDGTPNLSERMHGAVRQLAMDGQAGPLGQLADDLIDLCLKITPSWATVVPIEQLVRVIKRDLRVWGPGDVTMDQGAGPGGALRR